MCYGSLFIAKKDPHNLDIHAFVVYTDHHKLQDGMSWRRFLKKSSEKSKPAVTQGHKATDPIMAGWPGCQR